MKEFLCHFFLPHHTNNHRAKALHSDMLAFYIGAFALFYVVTRSIHIGMPDILGFATSIHVSQLLEMTNAKRAEAGLFPLMLNTQLSEAAAKKAADMFAKNYWAHVSPDGLTPWKFISGSGYSYAVAGENLAKNFQDSDGVVAAWMNSASHRDNLLKPGYKDIGFAIVNGVLNGEETTLVVQMFGATSAQAPLAKAPKVEVSDVAAAEVRGQQAGIASQFVSVATAPLVDMGALTRTTSYLFIGFLLSIMILDLWVVHRRKLVRASGHPVGHIIFFIVMLVILSSAIRGAVL